MDDLIAAVQSTVGQVLAAYRWVVEEGQVRQFRLATELAVLSRAQDGADVPVCYTVATGLWGVSHQALLAELGLDVARVVHGEQRFEIATPLEVGSEYTVRHRVSQTNVKEGKRGGRMLFVVIDTTVEDEAGALCVQEFHTTIQTER